MRKIVFFVFCIAFISCEEIFYETDISEERIKLLAPIKGAQLEEGTHSFTWEFIAKADTYRIQIASPSFDKASVIVLDSVLSKSMVEKPLLEGAYQWRVKAMNSISETVYTLDSLNIKKK